MFISRAAEQHSLPRRLSQLIGSTLALDYLRAGGCGLGCAFVCAHARVYAEYVAPLGSTSLIFNFLFASFLVGSPVTSNDIYVSALFAYGIVGRLT